MDTVPQGLPTGSLDVPSYLVVLEVLQATTEYRVQ